MMGKAMECVKFTIRDFEIMLESTIEYRQKVNDCTRLCRTGERRENMIRLAVETESLIKKLQKVVNK